MAVGRWLVCVLVASVLQQGACVCYFPGELQGVWETQVTSDRVRGGGRPPADLTYQNITIHSDVVMEWGTCFARVDNDVILSENTGDGECFRCVTLKLVSAQVLQVWTAGLQTCYTTHDAAYRSCPASSDLARRRASLLMLYKLWRSEVGLQVAGCPFNGRYTFTHRRRGGGGEGGSCSQPVSDFSNCPHGFGYTLTYRDCDFKTQLSRGLQCLGSWTGEDGENYLAVWDSSVQGGGRQLPRYRCGMFHEEVGTGRVLLALSEDSTCTNGLASPTDGHETYVLTSVPSPPLPPNVSAASCTFPQELHGHWHHTFLDADTAVFRDYRNQNTYSVRCVRDMDDGERFIVYARTHCGKWSYNCFWLKRRSANILEFMLGLYPKETLDPTLCDLRNFGDKTSWITQAKFLPEGPVSCPILGRYSGVLPDASGICAQLYSDCEAPSVMYYTVTACWNNSSVYEQREYQCLGQWEEDNRIYALTFRRDIRTYECFVGVIREDGVVFIKEAEAAAGCSRGVQPEVFGMKLHKEDACSAEVTSLRATHDSQRSTPNTRSPPSEFSTKPWEPITGRPRHRGSGAGGASSPSPPLLLLLLLAAATAVLLPVTCSF